MLHEVNRWTQILVQLCLFLGFLVFLRKREKSAAEREMSPLMSLALIFLGSAVVLPEFAATLNMSRIYHIALLFMSSCFVYGAECVQLTLQSVALHVKNPGHVASHPRVAASTRKWFLAATVLFIYFLFISGWFWAVTSDVPTSFVLDSRRMASSADPSVSREYFADFTVLSDINAAGWIRSYQASSRPVCADSTAKYHVLTSYGEYTRKSGKFYTDYLPDHCDFSRSYVYLSEYNTLHGLGSSYGPEPFPISDISPTLLRMNRAYSNGGATIYA
jgi:uncharacterized membrane protein